jgi:hypothetical protein
MYLKKWWLSLAVALTASSASLAHGSEKKVGDTKDGCDKSEVVKFQTSSGQAKVKANSPTQAFDLPGLTREITWYCGGSRERSANDNQFNRVKISRASNGAIQWTFFLVTGDTAIASNPPTQMGNSKDACDASHVVTFQAKDGPVGLKAGQSVFKELPALTRELSWKCDDSNERVANPNAFNFVQVERAGNGAIQWYFYRLQSVQDDSTGNYVDNVPGDLIIEAPILKKTESFPGFLKSNLDTFWDAQRTDIRDEILKQLKGDKRFQITSVTLSPASKAELRVGESSDNVLVKYVVHENTAAVSKSGANFVATFDIELAMFLPKQTTFPLQASKATAFVHHFELHGASAGDDFLGAFAKSRIHAVETNTNNFTQDVKKRVNDALKGIAGQIPAPAGTPLVLDAVVGTIQGCVKIQPSDQCSFPRPKVPPVVSRKVLDTSHDQCSANKVWIWDYQKGTYVTVPKGGGAVVEVDNQRFEWFCGGDAQPDPRNDEWATGPEGTFFVKITRAASGSQIDWSFESWH